MESCPVCGSHLEFVGKSSENDVNGHRARKFRCNNDNCSRKIVFGGWG